MQKNKFENPFAIFFESVEAQTLDAVVSPTLPVDPNLRGTATPTPVVTTPVQTPSAGKVIAELKSSSTSPSRGDSFKLNLNLKSNDKTVSKFKFVIKFNPSKLKVTSTNFTDTYFTTNKVAEANQQTGTIIIEGQAQLDARTVNREVGNINFTVESTGAIDITIDRTVSFINNSAGQNILEEVVNFSTSTDSNNQSPMVTSTNQIVEIPKSGLEDYAQYWPGVAGILLLAVSIWMVRIQRSRSNHDF